MTVAARRDEGRLIYVVWEITLRCDLACNHCGSRAGKPRHDELSTAEALDLIDQLAEMGAREVTLIGGEAYLRDDWTVLARAFRDKGIACMMTTGGRGVTPERAREAREAGLQNVSVSLDGTAPTHDLQRGLKGAYDAALGAIRNLREAGVPVSANTQINRLTMHELDDVYATLVREGCHAWQTQLTVAMGRAADRPEWLLQPYDVLEVIPKLAELTLRGRADGVRMWPANNIGYFGPHEATLRGSVKRGSHAGGCGAGKHSLGIESDGTIKGCPSLPTDAYTGGNIRGARLRELWDRAPALRFTRDRTTDELWGYCRDCYYASVCKAGCTWTAHSLFGRRGNNPYCHHRALELASRGLRERLTPIERAPGVPFDHGLFELTVEALSPDDDPTPRSDASHGRHADALPPLPTPRADDRRRLPVL